MKNNQFSTSSVKQLWRFSTIGLAVLAIVYFLKGYYHLLFDLDGAIDFNSRWRALQYIYQGHYPHPKITPGLPDFDSSIGAAGYGGYFPWSFFSMTVLIFPSTLGFARFYFGAVNLLLIAFTSAFVYRRYSRFSQQQGLFGVASVLAISAHSTTLGVGQFGIVLNALVILFLWCLEQNKLTLAGLFCGISLLKPNVTALYFLIPIARRNYWVAVVSILYTLLASVVIAIATNRSPLELTLIPLQGFYDFADQGNSLISIFTSLGVPIEWVVPLLGVIGVGICLLLFRGMRQFSLMEQFAIASVIGRLWTYHRVYDNVMLLFLYLAILDLSCEQPKSINLFMMYLLGVSLWLPAGIAGVPLIQTLNYLIWISSLSFVLLQRRRKLHQCS